ncbi:hypothetical protein CRYUN_Cryun37aG0020300 [Craigia yunnanensis]
MMEEQEEKETKPLHRDSACSRHMRRNNLKEGFLELMLRPIQWLKMLSEELHWSFVLGVVIVYGISQGFGVGLSRVSTQYYMKDEQKVQPSQAQVLIGIIHFPWIVKPLWGLLTDVVPILGYRRRPYFIFAGVLGVTSMLVLSLHKNLNLAFALLSLVAGSAGIAFADVAIDACVTQHTISYPSLAGDMQSLCGLSSSIGALLGFSLSGFFVHLVGTKVVFGLLSIPASLVVLVGILLRESYMRNFSYKTVKEKFVDAIKAMWTTLKRRDVWRPCMYMYLSLALGLHIHEGMFYWYTDAKEGPSFSQEVVGSIFSVGALGSLFGVLLYQNLLKSHPFRDILFWAQLLCGLLSSAWSGGLVLHMLKVTRTQFDNLWIAIVIRSLLRLIPIGFLFLIPRSDPNLSILPSELLRTKKGNDVLEPENIEMASLVNSI